MFHVKHTQPGSGLAFFLPINVSRETFPIYSSIISESFTFFAALLFATFFSF